MHPTRSILQVLALGLGLLLTACGGGGEPGDGGPNPPPPPPGTDDPPVLSVLAPQRPLALIPGDNLRVSFTAADDNAAIVRVLLDQDGNLGTDTDQTVLFQNPVDDGALQNLDIATTGLPPASATLFVEVDDGVNPPVASAGTTVLLYLGLAGVAPPRSNVYGVVGGFVGFTVGEAENGGIVLNQDGVADDGVMTFLDAATGLIQGGPYSADVTSRGLGGVPLILRAIQQSLAWDLLEADENRILNGDNDIADPMVAVVDPAMGPIANLVTLSTMRVVPTDSNMRRFGLAKEPAQGANVNLDGDMLDDVFTVIDTLGGAFICIDTPAAGSPFTASDNGTRNAFVVDEAVQGPGNLGIDLRADGDTIDILLAIVDENGNRRAFAGIDLSQMPAQLARNVDGTGAFATSDSDLAGYYIDEGAVGLVLNGDLDLTDFIPALYDVGTATESIPGFQLNAGKGARFFFLENTIGIYTAMEENTVNRNGDLDFVDTEVLHWTDMATSPGTANVVPSGVPGLPGLALDGGSAARLAPGYIGLVVGELVNQTDFNQDGDLLDQVFFLLDATSNPVQVFNTGLVPLPTGAIPGCSIPVTGVGGDDGAIIQVAESANGDLNGDGDNTDTLMYFINYASPGQPTSLSNTGGLHAANHGGRIGVTALEGFTNTDHNGDGDALDTLFRAFAADGTILEPGLISAPISIPTADDGSVWAWIRVEGFEGRDLNGDGDQVDHVFAIWLD